MHKRLSEGIFSQAGPYFGLPQINRTGGVEKCMGRNEGRNKRDIYIYIYFPQGREKKTRAARFAFGRCREMERGEGVSKKSQLERILGLETSRCV